jgi:hypothetical protein
MAGLVPAIHAGIPRKISTISVSRLGGETQHKPGLDVRGLRRQRGTSPGHDDPRNGAISALTPADEA